MNSRLNFGKGFARFLMKPAMLLRIFADIEFFEMIDRFVSNKKKTTTPKNG